MPQYDLVIPSGEAILVDRATGARLRLSSESGALKLGAVTFDLAFAPAPDGGQARESLEDQDALGQPKASQQPEVSTASAEAAEAVSAAHPSWDALEDKSVTRSALPDDPALEAFARMQMLPPGFGVNPAEAFLSPAESAPAPEPAANASKSSRGALRVLDAPLEGLTSEEFEKTLETLAARGTEMEREIEFLKEIDAEPEDITELSEALKEEESRFAAVSERFTDWQRLQRRVDEERGA